MNSTKHQAISKSLFLAQVARQRLAGLAEQIEREIKMSRNNDAANACLSLQITLLRARQQITDGIESALEAVA